VRPEAGEGGKEVVGVSMDVEERKGANSNQLGPPRLDFLNSGRQAGQGGKDEVSGGLPEGGGREGITKRGCQGRYSIARTDLLKKDQVRLVSLRTEGRPPRSARLLVLRERMVSREAMASPSSLGRGVLGDVL